MKRLLPVSLGLVFGFVTLLGCTTRPVLAAEPSVACPPARPRVVTHVLRHHVVHHYVTRGWYREVRFPACGSTVNPCNVEHLAAPVQ
jgi:hypothetical protein